MQLKAIDLSVISHEIHRPKKTVDMSKQKETFDENTIEILPEYTAILEALQVENQAIFVSGKAGTGKSTLIKYLVSKVENCAVVAPTAIAAVNVGGETIHSFFSLPVKVLNPDESYNLKSNMKPVIKDLGLLIIDEISMVSPNIIDVISNSLKKARNNELPFGGVSIVFIGDLLQLPPIVNDEEVGLFFTHRYESHYFYSADIFKEINIIPMELKKVFRQTDKNFINILNHIRVNHNHAQYIDQLNQKCLQHQNLNNDAITLVTTNAIAKAINEKKLKEINQDLITFNATYTGVLKQRKIHMPAPDILKLKIGAKIIFVKNDTNKLYLNGSLGTIVDFKNEHLLIQLNDTKNIISVGKESWDKVQYKYNYETQKVDSTCIGTFTQYPISLGWAITIHKSQGMTIDKINIDLGTRGAFAYGQTYVALSRCKALKGITLNQPIAMKDVRADPTILEFFNKIGFTKI